jgi:hypothetical protein
MVPRTILPTMMLQPRVKDFQVWKVLRGIIVGGRKPLEPLRFSLRYRRFVGAQGETYTLGPGGRHLPVAPTAVDLRPGPGGGAVGSLLARLQRQAATTRISSEEEGDQFSAYGRAGDFGFRPPAKSAISAVDSGVRRPPTARRQMGCASRADRARSTSLAAYLPFLRI